MIWFNKIDSSKYQLWFEKIKQANNQDPIIKIIKWDSDWDW